MRERIILNAKNIIAKEAKAIEGLVAQLDENFSLAAEAILACSGKVIVTGMGKSGHVGKKTAASLTSTGTPALFIHPAEALHGDLGVVAACDVVLAISSSGNTDEILRLIPFFKNNGNVIVAMTGNPDSSLARNSDYHISVAVNGEACHLSLAPTSSSTAALVMGDALTIVLSQERGFREEDFARLHPGGTLGRRLLTRVADVMRCDNLPIVPPDILLSDAILAISDSRLGMAVIVENGALLGVVTDGDVRRAMGKFGHRFFDVPVRDIMTREPKTIRADRPITEAEHIMQSNKVHSLVVLDSGEKFVGILEFYHLMI